jgi:hypothetical protein
MRRSLSVLAFVLSTALAGFAQTSPAVAPTYDTRWEIIDSGEVYSGTMTLAIDAKGAVTGKMSLTSPAPVTANVSGQVKGDVWTFKFPYTVMADTECNGTVAGTGKVPADRKIISGTATIEGCSETPLKSTFTLTRQEKK